MAIAYLYPDTGISPGFHLSLIRLMTWDVAHGAKVRYTLPRLSGANISAQRNACVMNFLGRSSANWLLMLDSDMTFEEDLIDNLLNAADKDERPIVGALAFAKGVRSLGGGRPDISTLWEAEPLLFPTIYQWTANEENPRLVVTMDYEENELVQVAATGAACLLVHRSAFERIVSDDPYRWFREERWPGEMQRMSEDLTFCRLAGEAGMPVYVHTGIRTGHEKTSVIGERAFKVSKPGTKGIEDLKFIVTGTGRCGTGFVSSVLNECGIACGHELVFGPVRTERTAFEVEGDSSWLALPAIEGDPRFNPDTRVVHLRRDTEKVIASLERIRFFEDEVHGNFRRFALQYSGCDNARDFVRVWRERCDEVADVTWNVEDICDVPSLRKFISDLGIQVPDDSILAAALEKVPTDFNTR